jgi:hypothetical protein
VIGKLEVLLTDSWHPEDYLSSMSQQCAIYKLEGKRRLPANTLIRILAYVGGCSSEEEIVQDIEAGTLHNTTTDFVVNCTQQYNITQKLRYPLPSLFPLHKRKSCAQSCCNIVKS